jgi:hypothetical protein
MFGGGVLRLDELRNDYGSAGEGSVEHIVREAGLRWGPEPGARRESGRRVVEERVEHRRGAVTADGIRS